MRPSCKGNLYAGRRRRARVVSERKLYVREIDVRATDGPSDELHSQFPHYLRYNAYVRRFECDLEGSK